MRYREITEDFNLDAYHGTTADFDAFDPGRTRDIGMHFGSATQADNAIKDVYGKRKDGANIIPVKLRVHNPLRVPDMFDTMRTTYINRAKTFCLLIRGFRASREERAAIFDAAKIADKARRKAGGDWGAFDRAKEQFRAPAEAAAKAFWQAVQVSAERQGYDGFVYDNKIEGKGDSYVVFRPQNIRSRYASFDPSKADSAKLMDARIVESVIRLGGLRVLKNPSQKQFESLLAKLNPDNNDKTMRGILDDTDLYLWDAIYAEHQGIADSLGLGADDYFEISGTTVVVNWGDKQYDKRGLKEFCERLKASKALHRILGQTLNLKVEYW